MRSIPFLLATALALATSTGSTAWAQSYPGKPVTVISAFPPTTLDFIIGLAVTMARRSPIAMELPTMSEAGIAGYEAAFGDLLLAPKGTPPAVLAALNEAIGAALSRPDVQNKLIASGVEFVANTPEQAAARMRREADKWARVVDRLGLRAG